MTTFADLRAILSDADSTAALVRYYERGWDRILAALALGIARPGIMRSRQLLRQIREIIKTLDPRKDSFVRHWIREYVRKAFLAGEGSSVDAISEGALRVPAREMTDTVGNAIAALDQKLGFVAAQMDATISAVFQAAVRAMLVDPQLRGGITAGILRSAAGRAVAQDLQTVILQGSDPVTTARLQQKGIPRFVTEGLDRVARGVITVGKASVSISSYVKQSAQDALGEVNNDAALIVTQRNEVDHVFIDKEATRNICAFCIEVEFNVFYNGSEAKDPAGFPRLKDLPPGPKWHPFCVHVITPWPIADKTPAEIEKALARSLKIPAACFGPSGTVEKVNRGGEQAIHEFRKKRA